MKNINERNNFVFEFRPVTELFEEQVKLHPEKCAVVSGKRASPMHSSTNGPTGLPMHLWKKVSDGRLS